MQWLVRPHRQNMRHVHAAFLLHHYGLRGRVKCAIAQSIGNEDNHVLQIAFRIRHDFLSYDG